MQLLRSRISVLSHRSNTSRWPAQFSPQFFRWDDLVANRTDGLTMVPNSIGHSMRQPMRMELEFLPFVEHNWAERGRTSVSKRLMATTLGLALIDIPMDAPSYAMRNYSEWQPDSGFAMVAVEYCMELVDGCSRWTCRHRLEHDSSRRKSVVRICGATIFRRVAVDWRLCHFSVNQLESH